MQFIFVLMLFLLGGLGAGVWKSVEGLTEGTLYFCKGQEHSLLLDSLIAFGLARLASDYGFFESFDVGGEWVCAPWSRSSFAPASLTGKLYYRKNVDGTCLLRALLYLYTHEIARSDVVLVYDADRRAFTVYR